MGATRTPEERQMGAMRARQEGGRPRIERGGCGPRQGRRPRAAGDAAARARAGNQKTRQGIVVSDRADKTITVRIDVARRHRRYEKIVRTSNTVHAHDESNDAQSATRSSSASAAAVAQQALAA